MIPEKGSITIYGYVTTPGYVTMIPKGYLVSERSDGTYVAPLIPDLFYGASGSQLQGTWRQWVGGTGEQVLLSRVAGHPEVPREELYWRKVAAKVPEHGPVAEAPKPSSLLEEGSLLLALGSLAVSGLLLFLARSGKGK